MRECVLCVRGRYASRNGLRCELCPSGVYGSQKGLQSARCNGKCAAGQYAAAGAELCTTCTHGRAAGKGQGACTACAEGHVATATGLAACEKCPGRLVANAARVRCISNVLEVAPSQWSGVEGDETTVQVGLAEMPSKPVFARAKSAGVHDVQVTPTSWTVTDMSKTALRIRILDDYVQEELVEVVDVVITLTSEDSRFEGKSAVLTVQIKENERLTSNLFSIERWSIQ